MGAQEQKHPETKGKPGHEHGQSQGKAPKGAESSITGCLSKGCKTTVARFGFCDEHYEQFKFGLIKKTGEPVSDYERKVDHYRIYRDRMIAKKKAG
jgi:hypothetical protein